MIGTCKNLFSDTEQSMRKTFIGIQTGYSGETSPGRLLDKIYSTELFFCKKIKAEPVPPLRLFVLSFFFCFVSNRFADENFILLLKKIKKTSVLVGWH